jgi:N-acetylglucosamine-6-phosphate deacetylase
LLIEGPKISHIGAGLSGGQTVDCRGLYVLSGFRDQHIHDLNGLMEHYDNSARLAKTSRSLASQGVTAYLLATTAAPTERLTTYLRTVKSYIDSETNGLDGARLEGANVEGTFIRKECAGAQPLEYIVSPKEPEAKNVFEAILATGAAKLVNIVPDFGVDLIHYAVSKGAIVGCGHSLASAEQLAEGFRYGLKFIVHLTNGGMGRSFKPFDGGGAYEGALSLPLFVELIIDGYHVNLRYVSDIIWRRVQQGRSHEIIAVTDGIFPVPEETPEGEFRVYSTVCTTRLGDDVFFVKGRVDNDGSMTSVPPNTLCSSRLTMRKTFENILNLLTSDIQGFMIDRKALPLYQAMKYAAMFTSANQALMQGSSHTTGTISRGKQADLTILNVEGQPEEYKVEIVKTVVAGNVFNFS